MFSKLVFILRARLGGHSHVSFSAELKRPEAIRLGARCKIHSRAIVDADGGGGVTLGDRVAINRYALLQGSRGGIRIGPGAEINNFTVVNGTGGVDIGADVLIGPHARLISYSHRFDDPARSIKAQALEGAPIRIGDGAWIGAGATILAGVEIGAGSVVGAGAVVTRSCPPGSVLVGVPARVVKNRYAVGGTP